MIRHRWSERQESIVHPVRDPRRFAESWPLLPIALVPVVGPIALVPMKGWP